MNSPIFKSEKKAAKGGKKPKLSPELMPKTPGGWAVYNLMGVMKEAQEREKRRIPK